MSLENTLDLVFFCPHAVGFVPMNLRSANRTIRKLDIGDAFQLSPAGFSVHLPEPSTLADRRADSNDLYVLDPADNLEMHQPVPLSPTNLHQNYEQPLVLPQLIQR